MGLFYDGKASAASITATPKHQRITNVLARAEWHVSWSGVPSYTVFFIPDTGLEFYTIASNAWFNSKYFQHRYDLGTRSVATYNPRFLVADYHAMAFTDVTVTHERTN